MSEDKLPTGKIERAARFLKTGLKMGTNVVAHNTKKAFGAQVTDEELQEKNANALFDSMADLKGSALKVAQMLSMDNINFSSSFTNVMAKSQYSVPPMSAPLAVRTFAKALGREPEQVFDKFNPQATKAASMGQVHEAWKDGRKFAVKIQYPGVADSVRSDMSMMRGVAQRVLNMPMHEIAPYLKEVEEKLIEESNYRLELENSISFSQDCQGIDGLVFPQYFPEYSSERVITMEWIEGKHLKEFMATEPSQEVRERAARALWDFYEYQIHVLKKVNADPHPGNFLFRPDGSVGVLDFGCTKVLSQELYDDYFAMANPGLFDDMEKAEALLLQLEILRPSDSADRRRYLIDLFGQLIKLIAKPYHLGSFNFNNDEFYKEITRVGTEISKLRELRGSREFLFINRTYFGLFSLFQTLDVAMETTCQFGDFLFPEVKAARAAEAGSEVAEAGEAAPKAKAKKTKAATPAEA